MMGTIFIKLAINDTKSPYMVNVSHIIGYGSDGDSTNISIATGVEDFVYEVVETPEEITKLIEEAKWQENFRRSEDNF